MNRTKKGNKLSRKKIKRLLNIAIFTSLSVTTLLIGANVASANPKIAIKHGDKLDVISQQIIRMCSDQGLTADAGAKAQLKAILANSNLLVSNKINTKGEGELTFDPNKKLVAVQWDGGDIKIFSLSIKNSVVTISTQVTLEIQNPRLQKGPTPPPKYFRESLTREERLGFLRGAITGSDAKVVGDLLGTGNGRIPPNTLLPGTNQTPLLFAMSIDNPNIDVVLQILHTPGVEVDARGSLGESALILVAKKGRSDIVQALIEHGADVNACTTNGKTTPLIRACQFSCFEVAKLLFEKGARIDVFDVNGVTPLIAAAQEGNLNIFEFLVQNGADINWYFPDKQITPLSAAIYSGNPELIKFIVDYPDFRADIHFCISMQLVVAIRTNKFEIVEILLHSGKFPVNSLVYEFSKVLELEPEIVQIVEEQNPQKWEILAIEEENEEETEEETISEIEPQIPEKEEMKEETVPEIEQQIPEEEKTEEEIEVDDKTFPEATREEPPPKDDSMDSPPEKISSEPTRSNTRDALVQTTRKPKKVRRKNLQRARYQKPFPLPQDAFATLGIPSVDSEHGLHDWVNEQFSAWKFLNREGITMPVYIDMHVGYPVKPEPFARKFMAIALNLLLEERFNGSAFFITGQGGHSQTPGISRVKQGVVDFLHEIEKIPSEEMPGNPGRIQVIFSDGKPVSATVFV